jgi:hypothetical protein
VAVKSIHNLGMLLLSLFLVIAGVRGLFSLAYSHLNLLANLLALFAGILILFSSVSGGKNKA